MNKLFELKNTLFNYVGKYLEEEKKLNSMSYDVSLYEEILNCLFGCIEGIYDKTSTLGICLDTLFGNKYDELLQCIYAKKKLDLLNISDNKINTKLNYITNQIKIEYLEIKKQYDELKNNLDINKKKFISSKRILSSLKYKQIILREDIKNIDDVLRESISNDTDISIMIENLFVHNKNIISKEKGYRYQDKYKFINLLTLGYEKIDYPYVEDERKLDDIALVIINLFEHYSDDVELEDYIKLLPVIGNDVKNIDELEYVLIRVLENLNDKLIENIELIKDKDFILDLESKTEISNDCYGLIYKYNLVRKYMDDEINNHKEEIEMDIEDNNNEINNLFYLENENGKCYLLSDLEKFPLEYLDKAIKLIQGFKQNTLSKKKIKRMIENQRSKGFLELKDDQIRILYKKISSHDYVVYGAFVKKDDRKYKIDLFNVCDREGNISDDSCLIEEELNKYVSENSRKWSR